ncbi:unnamed protein product [Closterium sp. NIES-65]|nr:unnamed protein product [Closterium sp. NIES-65]
MAGQAGRDGADVSGTERPGVSVQPPSTASSSSHALSSPGATAAARPSKPNPFGAARPREQVIAERKGVTEADLLRELASKEWRPTVVLSEAQKEEQKAAEAELAFARDELARAPAGDEARRAELEGEVKAREATLHDLLASFEYSPRRITTPPCPVPLRSSLRFPPSLLSRPSSPPLCPLFLCLLALCGTPLPLSPRRKWRWRSNQPEGEGGSGAEWSGAGRGEQGEGGMRTLPRSHTGGALGGGGGGRGRGGSMGARGAMGMRGAGEEGGEEAAEAEARATTVASPLMPYPYPLPCTTIAFASSPHHPIPAATSLLHSLSFPHTRPRPNPWPPPTLLAPPRPYAPPVPCHHHSAPHAPSALTPCAPNHCVLNPAPLKHSTVTPPPPPPPPPLFPPSPSYPHHPSPFLPPPSLPLPPTPTTPPPSSPPPPLPRWVTSPASAPTPLGAQVRAQGGMAAGGAEGGGGAGEAGATTAGRRGTSLASAPRADPPASAAAAGTAEAGVGTAGAAAGVGMVGVVGGMVAMAVGMGGEGGAMGEAMGEAMGGMGGEEDREGMMTRQAGGDGAMAVAGGTIEVERRFGVSSC